MSRIFIIDDDISFGIMLQTWLRKQGYEVEVSSSVKTAEDILRKQSFNLIISDLRLPDGDGIMLLSWLRERKITTPFFVMTGYADVQSAVLAMKLGAMDYLQKPIIPDILKTKVETALKQKPAEASKDGKRENRSFVKGNSETIRRVYSHISLVAPTKMSVLLLGESGTGKEYLARMIHEQSNRKNKPFVAVDCGSLSKELAPSELFGHLKGSFTTAIADKKGVFTEASGGTVFLDEIGNLSYEVQKQLLRALQEQKVRPVGSVNDISIDVRIVAATNEDLNKAIAEGRFRQDLYHRINEFSIIVPPLRERVEDIPEFVECFIAEANEELGKSVNSIDKEALSTLQQQQWNGNLRELRNVIRRAVLFAENDTITIESLPVFQTAVSNTTASDDLALRPGDEENQIKKALYIAHGNKTIAARLLQIDRKTLYNKMHAFGMI